LRLALAGDTMLGRGVAERLSGMPASALVSPEVTDAFREADAAVLNLECCISERGARWPAPGKPFFFRAPPGAVDLLNHLGVRCVTLANNHALDYGVDALLDTFAALDAAGVLWVGAGPYLERARAPVTFEVDGSQLAVFGATDHPLDFAAAPDGPGVALLDHEQPTWLTDAVASARADAVLVTPHWGPNMVDGPIPEVRRTSERLVAAGATLVAGHSAHVFHGVAGRVLFDLGDFLDDYRVDPVLRNDLGILALVDLGPDGPRRLEVVPLKLDFAYTRLAERADARWIEQRFGSACAQLGTSVETADGRLVVDLVD
jgi:poly-gamma-glutamate capsule biosynthesis protein CapA/YwtB (metallophosphatase superfamily)